MIVITGAAGFIGSCMITKLNEEGFRDLILVDDFSRTDKRPNYEYKEYSEKVDRAAFFNWVRGKEELIQYVLHLGARTDTTEQDQQIFDELNLHYSQQIWELCTEHAIPLIYASSAATYGGGEFGFDDDEALTEKLKPLNPYGISKNDFDRWALAQSRKPFFWAGLKFFNVYGPNEYHKGRMASVVFHAYHQIMRNGELKLFRSHRPDYADGEQRRDFIYVKDVLDVIFFLMNHRKDSGLYNLGTGKARTFNDLGKSVFAALDQPSNIVYIDTPEDIRESYQYFTEANMEKLRRIGYDRPFTSLEAGIDDYVRNYLRLEKHY